MTLLLSVLDGFIESEEEDEYIDVQFENGEWNPMQVQAFTDRVLSEMMTDYKKLLRYWLICVLIF